MTLTSEQQTFLTTVKKSANACVSLAAKAEKENLKVLASFLRECSFLLISGVDFQERAFREGSLQDADKPSNTVDERIAIQSEALAETIARRFKK